MTPVETTPRPPPITQFGPQWCHLHQLWWGKGQGLWMMMPVTIGGFGLMMMPVTTGLFGLMLTPIGRCGLLTDTPIGPCMPTRPPAPAPALAEALEVASAVMPRAATAVRAKIEVRLNMGISWSRDRKRP